MIYGVGLCIKGFIQNKGFGLIVMQGVIYVEYSYFCFIMGGGGCRVYDA